MSISVQQPMDNGRSRSPSPLFYDNTFSDLDDESDDENTVEVENDKVRGFGECDADQLVKDNSFDSHVKYIAGPNFDDGTGRMVKKPNFINRQFSGGNKSTHEDDSLHEFKDETDKLKQPLNANEDINTSLDSLGLETETQPNRFTQNNIDAHDDTSIEVDFDTQVDYNVDYEIWKAWNSTWELAEDDLIKNDQYTDPTVRIDPSLMEEARAKVQQPVKPQWTKYHKFPRMYHIRPSRKRADEISYNQKTMAEAMTPLNILSKMAKERGKEPLQLLDECDKHGYGDFVSVRFPCMQCYEKQGAGTTTASTALDYLFGGGGYQDYPPVDSEDEDKCKQCGGKIQTLTSFIKMLIGLRKICQANELTPHDVYPDGNCLFGAIVDQLRIKGVFDYTVQGLRTASVKYLRENPMSSDGETHFQLFLTEETWDQYLNRMSKDGEWGDHMVISAIANLTHQRIVIFGGRLGEGQTVILPTDMQEPVKKETTDEDGKMEDVPDEDKTTNANVEGDNLDKVHTKSKKNDGAVKNITESQEDENTGEKVENEDKSEGEGKDNNAAQEPVIKIYEKKGTIFLGHVGESHYISLRPKDWQERLVCPKTDDTDQMTDFPKANKLLTVPEEHLNFFLLQFLQFKYIETAHADELHLYQIHYDEANDNSIGRLISKMYPFVENVNTPGADVRQFLGCQNDDVEMHINTESRDSTVILHTPNDTIVTTSSSKAGRFDLVAEERVGDPVLLRLSPYKPDKWRGQTQQLGGREYLEAMDPFPREHKLLSFSMAWPKAAKSWVLRDRQTKWPEACTIVRIEEGGVNVIPIIHATEMQEILYEFPTLTSDQTLDPLNWVISFAVPERELASNTTPAQRNVYFLFDLIVQNMLKTKLFPMIACKHIFFYACENIKSIYWESHPGTCLLILLKKLTQSLSDFFMPHYFIPTKNLYTGIPINNLQEYWNKIEFARTRPLMTLHYLLDKFNVTATEVGSFFDEIQEGMVTFQIHNDTRRSALECFLPASCNLLESFLYQGEYEFTLQTIMCVKEMIDAEDADGGIEIADIIRKGLWNMHAGYQWCLAFYFDIKLNTTLSRIITSGQQTIPITQVFGPEITSMLPDTVVPRSLAPDVGELHFPTEVIKIFRLAGKTTAIPKCLRYYLDTYYDYLRHDYIRSASQAQLLFNLYITLFNTYLRNGEKEEFRDILPRLMDIVRDIQTKEAFKQVATVCRHLGAYDKASEFENKKVQKASRGHMFIMKFAEY